MGVAIKNIACYRPVVSNELHDSTGNWEYIENFANLLSGNVKQHQCHGESVVSMGSKAAQSCLQEANIAADEVDLIIHVSSIPDHVIGDATKIQNSIKASQAATFQIKDHICTGTLMAFIQAVAFIEANIYRNVLVVSVSNIVSRTREHSKFTSRFLSDMATAILFSRSSTSQGLMANFSKTTGEIHQYSQLLVLEHSLPDWPSEFLQKCNGSLETLREISQKNAEYVITRTLEKASLEKHHVDWFITLNAQERSLQNWRNIIDIPEEKHLHTSHEIATASLCSIPYTLMKAIENNSFALGDMILLFAEGAGLHSSCILWKW